MNNKEYEIKGIINKQYGSGEWKYLVHWKDGTRSLASLSSLTGCGDTLLHFEARQACDTDEEDVITFYRFTKENEVFVEWKKGKSEKIILDPVVCNHLKRVLSKEGVDIKSKIESFMLKPSGSFSEEHLRELCPALWLRYQEEYIPVQLNVQKDGDGGLCDMGDVVVMEKETSLYPYLSLSLTRGIKQLRLALKVKIEHTVKGSSYHEDMTIFRKSRDAFLLDATLLPEAQAKIVCNIELKTSVASSWRLISLNDLVETILYSKYYVQTKQADNTILAVLTDLYTWHVFSLHSTEKSFNCNEYFMARTGDVKGIHGIVCAVLRLLNKETS